MILFLVVSARNNIAVLRLLLPCFGVAFISQLQTTILGDKLHTPTPVLGNPSGDCAC